MKMFITCLLAVLPMFLDAQQPSDSLKSTTWEVKLFTATATNKELLKEYDRNFPKKLEIVAETIILYGKSDGGSEQDLKYMGSIPLDSSVAGYVTFSLSTASEQWTDSLWGFGRLKVNNKNMMEGKYQYSKSGEKGEVKMVLERIWRCSNHNPQHCTPDLQTNCSGLH